MKKVQSLLFGVTALVLSACVPATEEPPRPSEAPTPAATASVQEIVRVTNDPGVEYWPRPSPDGKNLLFGVYDDTKSGIDAYSVALVSTKGVGKRLIAGPGAMSATWLPDGSGIVYIYLGSGRAIVRSPIAGAGLTFITNNQVGERDGEPDVSPDGKRVAFGTLVRGVSFIYSVGIDGSAVTQYVQGSSPRWSPSGEKIAFDREVGSSRYQLFVIDIGTGQVTQLTTGNYSNAYPAWSPDGQWITFQSNREGRNQVYIMKADGTSVTQLTRGDGESITPNWSSDGFIYFVSKQINQWAVADIWRLKPKLP
ncbi:MAG: DPP IV N-terminal domain-containing protein [Deinococcus sp.]|nr:DPP IV N-terminal domain-containing protein [Deinococcus sp.]